MANPNIVNVTAIYGKTTVTNLSTANATLVVENTASSNKVFKINSLIVSNVNGSNTGAITIGLYSSANIGGTSTEIIRTATVPADSTLVVVSKDTSFYLEEDKSIGATASTANTLKIICSYEEIS